METDLSNLMHPGASGVQPPNTRMPPAAGSSASRPCLQITTVNVLLCFFRTFALIFHFKLLKGPQEYFCLRAQGTPVMPLYANHILSLEIWKC